MERAARQAVFVAPAECDELVRMRRAHAAAAQQFRVSASGPEVWGWQGRTLGRRAGDCWLRIVSAGTEKASGRLWEGTATADTHVPRSVPRPRLRGVLDWTAPDVAYRAELTEYVSIPPVTSGTPALDQDIALPDSWWSDLKSALGTLATVPTDRESVRQSWVDRNFRRFLGIDPVRIRETTTGHADLHWANLTGAPLVVLDWENWELETRTRMSNTSPALGTPPVAAQPLPATRAASDAPPPVRTGHCQCGRISYQVTGVPDDPHLCSCVHETRISGGPAVLWVGFPLDTLSWTGPGGEPKWYATYPTLRRGFCPDCVMQAARVSNPEVSHLKVGRRRSLCLTPA